MGEITTEEKDGYVYFKDHNGEVIWAAAVDESEQEGQEQSAEQGSQEK